MTTILNYLPMARPNAARQRAAFILVVEYQHLLRSPYNTDPCNCVRYIYCTTLPLYKTRHFQTCSNSKHLTLSQTTNFRLFQTERVCRRQILI